MNYQMRVPTHRPSGDATDRNSGGNRTFDQDESFLWVMWELGVEVHSVFASNAQLKRNNMRNTSQHEPSAPHTRGIWRVTASLFASFALTLGVIGTASADPIDQTVNEAIGAIEEVDPQLLDGAVDVVPDEEGEVAIQSDAAGVQITVPNDPVDQVTVDSDSGTISIGLPGAEDASNAVAAGEGVVIYDNNNDSATAPVVREDGTVQINTVIQSPSAPTEYAYQIELPEGSTIVRDGGSLYFMKGETLVGGLAPAWAQDAEGRQVPTRYEVEGNRVTQIVEHDATFNYPIVADPWLGINLFKYVSNSVRPLAKGKPVYTVELSWWGQTIYRGGLVYGIYGLPLTAAGYKIMTTAGWDEIIKRQPKANTTSIKQQYVCHVRYGYPVLGSGWRWDFEAWRSSYPGWTRANVLSHRCNWDW